MWNTEKCCQRRQNHMHTESMNQKKAIFSLVRARNTVCHTHISNECSFILLMKEPNQMIKSECIVGSKCFDSETVFDTESFFYIFFKIWLTS